jgi:DNA-binding NarL/FixJ family response regulator
MSQAKRGALRVAIDPDASDDGALRTVVADDDALARRLIRDTLQHAGITVVADATVGREAVELAIYYRPDVVLMDHMMPGIDGIEATRRVHAHDASIRVVVLAEAHDDELGLRALRAGAVGFLSKETDLDALPRLLRGVRNGEAAISRQFAMTLIEHFRMSSIVGEGLRPVRSCLTAREWEVLDLLATGLTNEQIADTLVLSTETVRTHIKHLYRKLDVHSRQDAVHEAARLRGLADPAVMPWGRERTTAASRVRRAAGGDSPLSQVGSGADLEARVIRPGEVEDGVMAGTRG